MLILQKDGAYSFKGIPYAAPPVGPLRWAPPAEPVCSSGVSDAGCFRSACPQVRPLSKDGRVIGQEDCLFLNVWTPTLSQGAKLPVVVWIHGGYLLMLSGGEPQYSPTEKLAADTRMVYVSFNYRLNAFGFMALKILSEGSPTSTSGQSVMMVTPGFQPAGGSVTLSLDRFLDVSRVDVPGSAPLSSETPSLSRSPHFEQPLASPQRRRLVTNTIRRFITDCLCSCQST